MTCQGSIESLDDSPDGAAQTAFSSADAHVKAAFVAFDEAWGDERQATGQIAETIRTSTAAATEETAGPDARSAKTAEWAVAQAKIRVRVNGL